jgi:hypothetical protein
MFIRQTRTGNKATGESYVTYRLVRTERIGGKVRQITVLNLGRHFPIKPEDWPLLCSRLEQLLNPQALIMPWNVLSRSSGRPSVTMRSWLPARRRWRRRLTRWPDRRAKLARRRTSRKSMSTRCRLTQPRSVGVEQVGLLCLEANWV